MQGLRFVNNTVYSNRPVINVTEVDKVVIQGSIFERN